MTRTRQTHISRSGLLYPVTQWRDARGIWQTATTTARPVPDTPAMRRVTGMPQRTQGV